MSFSDLVYGPFQFFTTWPLAALVPAGAFAALAFVRRRPAVIAAAAWAAYALYESLVKARVLCSGECNIRVDLVLFAPVLWLLTIGALIGISLPRRGR